MSRSKGGNKNEQMMGTMSRGEKGGGRAKNRMAVAEQRRRR